MSLGYLYGALCAPAIVIGGPFMIFWMGPYFAAPSTPVLRLLIMGIWATVSPSFRFRCWKAKDAQIGREIACV